MRSIDALVDSAAQLTDQGLTRGEIADELNVSRETATWLVDQSDPSAEESATATPIDVHVDWSAIGQNSSRLRHLGAIMADLVAQEGADVDLTIGVGKSGGPLATVVSQHLDTDVGGYMPSKYQTDEEATTSGSFSRNFAAVDGRDCYVVDDNIDTGQTMTEAIDQIRAAGGTPRAVVVLTDKLGQDAISDVRVYSLIEMVQMGGE